VGSGAGRIEQAVRAHLAGRDNVGRGITISLNLVASRLGWDDRSLTRSQRSSIPRAIHRVIGDHPGWQRECSRASQGREYRNVRFYFAPAEDLRASEAKKLALDTIAQRPVSRRQRTKDRAAKRQRSADLADRQQLLAELATMAGRPIPANATESYTLDELRGLIETMAWFRTTQETARAAGT
jgi:hypothetical protein